MYNETIVGNTIKISTYKMHKRYNSFSFRDNILSKNESIFIKPFLIKLQQSLFAISLFKVLQNIQHYASTLCVQQ